MISMTIHRLIMQAYFCWLLLFKKITMPRLFRHQNFHPFDQQHIETARMDLTPAPLSCLVALCFPHIRIAVFDDVHRA